LWRRAMRSSRTVPLSKTDTMRALLLGFPTFERGPQAPVTDRGPSALVTEV
jgi:hypothetical protein